MALGVVFHYLMKKRSIKLPTVSTVVICCTGLISFWNKFNINVYDLYYPSLIFMHDDLNFEIIIK